MIKPWPCLRTKSNQSFRVFSVRTDTVLSPRTGTEHDFYIIESTDWVNIIPITADRQVLMIKQYRHGSGKVTLEIPGGMVNPGDTPEGAACRELLEETGYHAKDWRKIGEISPNPAIFNNRCHIFMARNLTKVSIPLPDQAEDIEPLLFPIRDIPELIQKGEIDHAMVIAAFHYYFLNPTDG